MTSSLKRFKGPCLYDWKGDMEDVMVPYKEVHKNMPEEGKTIKDHIFPL
jgi:hypothetical protein